MHRPAIHALVLAVVSTACVHRAGSERLPAQEAAAPPAAADTAGFVCVVEGGSLRLLPTHVDAQSGDTLVRGVKLSQKASDTTTYVGRARWFESGEVVAVPRPGRTQRYTQQGPVHEFYPPDVRGLRPVHQHRGAPLFVEVASVEDWSTLYVLVRPPCGFAAYVGV